MRFFIFLIGQLPNIALTHHTRATRSTSGSYENAPGLSGSAYGSAPAQPTVQPTPSYLKLSDALVFFRDALKPSKSNKCSQFCYTANVMAPEGETPFTLDCKETLPGVECFTCIDQLCQHNYDCNNDLYGLMEEQRFQVIRDTWVGIKSRDNVTGYDKKTTNCMAEVCVRSRVVGYADENLSFFEGDLDDKKFGKMRARCAVDCGNQEGAVSSTDNNDLRLLNCEKLDGMETACFECLTKINSEKMDDDDDEICKDLSQKDFDEMIKWLKRNKGDSTCNSAVTGALTGAGGHGSSNPYAATVTGYVSQTQKPYTPQTQNSYGSADYGSAPHVTRIHKRIRHVCIKKSSKLGLILGLGLGIPVGLLLLALCCVCCLGVGVCGLGGLGGLFSGKEKKKSHPAPNANYAPIPAYAPVTTTIPYSTPVQYSSAPPVRSQSPPVVRAASPTPMRAFSPPAPIRSTAPIRSSSPIPSSTPYLASSPGRSGAQHLV